MVKAFLFNIYIGTNAAPVLADSYIRKSNRCFKAFCKVQLDYLMASIVEKLSSHASPRSFTFHANEQSFMTVSCIEIFGFEKISNEIILLVKYIRLLLTKHAYNIFKMY
ncbi:hypothetical protein BpHYR1_026943 [Brachionus plicatilis]|uniref:Uncharacterized protein n=1 Tax=Brachionus plicatilis TaxID=10195 RepID=A0A3M7PAF3_BRAPC|nr:hypothetical protein BpHYR1_026943 [Brachionus plicatilis]